MYKLGLTYLVNKFLIDGKDQPASISVFSGSLSFLLFMLLAPSLLTTAAPVFSALLWKLWETWLFGEKCSLSSARRRCVQTGTVGPNPRDGFWVGPGGISSISSNGLMILFNFIYFHFIGLRGVLFLKIRMTVRDMRKQPLLICVFTRISHAVVTTDPHTALAHVRCLAHCLQRAHAHTHPCQLLYKWGDRDSGNSKCLNCWKQGWNLQMYFESSSSSLYSSVCDCLIRVCIFVYEHMSLSF